MIPPKQFRKQLVTIFFTFFAIAVINGVAHYMQ